MKIINLSNFETSWNWLRDEFSHPGQWRHVTTDTSRMPKGLPLRNQLAGFSTAISAVALARMAGRAILVSHGPRPAFYAGMVARLLQPDLPHLACSFNFTNLPTGKNRVLMAASYRQVRKFLTYSTVERTLYAEYFGIPLEKIDMLHWAVHPPAIDPASTPIESGDYICALGSQARDYGTLFAAIEKLPHIKLVVVANLESIHDLHFPSNVKVHMDIPRERALNILQHSRFMVLPLRDSRVPCGHVTIVSAMFFGKAIIVTDSTGVHDYIQDRHNGLFYDSRDVAALRLKVDMLWNDSAQAAVLASAARAFAYLHCTHVSAVNYFKSFTAAVQAG